MAYIFIDKKSSGGAVTRAEKSAHKSLIITEQQLAKEWHK